MNVKKLSHQGLCVSDLPRALAFYRDGLGFEEVSRMTFTDPGTQRLLGLPGACLDRGARSESSPLFCGHGVAARHQVECVCPFPLQVREP